MITPSRMKDRDLKVSIRRLLNLVCNDLDLRGGLGNGEAEEGHQGPTTPDRANRPVDQAEVAKGKDRSRTAKPLCRVIGYLPHLKASSCQSLVDG